MVEKKKVICCPCIDVNLCSLFHLRIKELKYLEIFKYRGVHAAHIWLLLNAETQIPDMKAKSKAFP